jgi:hypothetical protein
LFLSFSYGITLDEFADAFFRQRERYCEFCLLSDTILSPYGEISRLEFCFLKLAGRFSDFHSLLEQFSRQPLVYSVFKKLVYLKFDVFILVFFEQLFGKVVYNGFGCEKTILAEGDVF